VVPGGRSRQESVAAALDAIPAGVDLVLVHDAVRPFVPKDRIDAVIEAVRAFGAAALAVSVTDTLRRNGDSVFGETVPRHGLYRMQTPQGFRVDWFLAAHRAARSEGFEETDDVALVQRLGKSVRVVEGSPANIKVTTPDDWRLAQALWRHLSDEI
jgi:2-C-methyl-D-erythritol 4-phosphate cytidylyltransferase